MKLHFYDNETKTNRRMHQDGPEDIYRKRRHITETKRSTVANCAKTKMEVLNLTTSKQ